MGAGVVGAGVNVVGFAGIRSGVGIPGVSVFGLHDSGVIANRLSKQINMPMHTGFAFLTFAPL